MNIVTYYLVTIQSLSLSSKEADCIEPHRYIRLTPPSSLLLPTWCGFILTKLNHTL
jgi:hypothetical protein